MNRDIIYNIGSVGVIGLVGLLLNTLIPIFYSVEALGHFNFVMSLFMFFSQFTTFGLHYSTLKHTAEQHQCRTVKSLILSSSLCLCVIFVALFVLPFLFLPKVVPQIFKFDGAAFSWFLVMPAILFFSLNKILLSFVNGEMKMTKYAAYISLRYSLMLCFFFVLVALKLPIKYISLIFLISEALLLCILLYHAHTYLSTKYICMPWVKRHLEFSWKSFLAGASIELNSRIDLLILLYYQTEESVGIYSFALFFVEGTLQIIAALRNVLNPLITDLYYKKDVAYLKNVIRKFGMQSLFITLAVMIMCPIFMTVYINKTEAANLSGSVIVFLYIMVGVLFSSYFLPTQFLANQTGHPTRQTRLNFLILISNIALNLICISQLGLYGAALGTSLSFFVAAFVIKLESSNILKGIS